MNKFVLYQSLEISKKEHEHEHLSTEHDENFKKYLNKYKNNDFLSWKSKREHFSN